MAQLAYPLDNKLYVAADASIWHATRVQGVYSSDNDFAITATTNMTVNVSPGTGFLKPSRFENAVYVNTDDVQFTLDTPDGYFKRIDRIVIRWDKIPVPNTVLLQVKKGTPGGSPVAPALQRDAEAHEIAIADITVPPGTLQIIQGNINNAVKLDETLCGIMRDGVTQIPTQQLYDAWWSWFSALKLDAETKARDFTAWMDLFRSQSESDFLEWFNNFKTTYQSQIENFMSLKIQEVNAWFASFSEDWQNTLTDLQSTLTENQAANLFSKIDLHEKTVVNTAEVHGTRLHEGKFQLFVGTGWATVAVLPIGYTVGYFRQQNFTVGTFRAIGYTVGTFKNQIRVEE